MLTPRLLLGVQRNVNEDAFSIAENPDMLLCTTLKYIVGIFLLDSRINYCPEYF